MKLNQDKTITSRTEFFYYAFRNILLIGLPLVLISAFVLSVSHSSATNSTSDSVRISIPTSCTLSGNVTADHATSMVSGQEKLDIGTTQINTICNDKDGYLVYAKGTTQNSSGEVVLSSSLGSNYDIKTGNIPSTSGNSSWAMKLSLPTSDYPPVLVSGYDSYTPVPNTWTKVAYRSAGTATSSNATSIFTTTYAVYTTPGQPAGTYSGEVKYVMFHPSTTTVVPSLTLEGAFASAGKQKKQDVTDPVTGQTGDFYKMQDMDTSICQAVTPNDNPGYNEIQLVDDRDNKIYWVTKLKDGNCWMTQNLDLDLSASVALTSNNTDLNDNSLTGAYAEGYNYDTTNNIITWTPSSSVSPWGNNTYHPRFKDVGKYYPEGTPTQETINDYHKLSGNYYNWTAAIASNDSSSITASTYNNTKANPQNSICPKGWRLPTISSIAVNNEFRNLINNYENYLVSPLWLVRSGYAQWGDIYESGANAIYWSSTVYNKGYAYRFYYGANRYEDYLIGQSLRCLAK